MGWTNPPSSSNEMQMDEKLYACRFIIAAVQVH